MNSDTVQFISFRSYSGSHDDLYAGGSIPEDERASGPASSCLELAGERMLDIIETLSEAGIVWRSPDPELRKPFGSRRDGERGPPGPFVAVAV